MLGRRVKRAIDMKNYLYRHEPKEGWEVWLCDSATNDRLELIDAVRSEREAQALIRRLNKGEPK